MVKIIKLVTSKGEKPNKLLILDIPLKSMREVVFVKKTFSHAIAIKEDNSLWIWGENFIPKNDEEAIFIPTKIIDNVFDE